MSNLKKKLQEEKGSMTLEFLTVMPYYFFFFLLLWQAVASGLTMMKAQSAVNEAAKYYAVTEEYSEAYSIASDAIGVSDIMTFQGFDIHTGFNGEFEAVIQLRHGLVFVPKEWRNKASINFTHKVNSRVIK
ncbi:pilus assembly protein [Bacillus sp. ISL-47]|uniref:pilus assembly protein n=1 Tax=Bacillus sp. ISL-47 TaxID=2819130 RepID=UPI001BE5FC21|nr:pilus assembly protein [Bacillus sp. ISL-47]MBT2691245.1 pilus assembly protein [Bacillus sp. ISL-47]MBT2708923.1 hypothetical protein [Pseudomonas sp. ISL-84]